jgi:SAM-dependent methyltransferase
MEPDEYARMDALESRMWWYRALHARLLDALAAYHVSGPILDAGCGTGGFLAALTAAHPTCAAFGLEWFEAATAIAAAKSGRPIARGNINTLPFATNSFGTVITADVLCHAAVAPQSSQPPPSPKSVACCGRTAG